MYQPIACIPTGCQRGDERFVGEVAPPNLRGWRCDLTALSRQHNLYFLASVDEIHVYQPSFPDQNLSSEAELVLYPPRSGTGGPGIDPLTPHSITRILVDYLGNEEILLLACDDGDVVAYRTREIHRALERRTNMQEPANKDDIHVFFYRNVGASAWGLAVHREARIIAISANTHEITIIAFALVLDGELEVSDHDSFESPSPEPRFPYSRRKNDIFTLSATNNIPALSFYGDSGRWLLSSCIDGKTSIWDLHTKQEIATFELGWCASASDLSTSPRYIHHRFQCNCPGANNVLHGAWGTLALDTRFAHELSSEDASSLNSEPISNGFLDVSNQKKRFSVSKRISSSTTPGETDSDSDIAEEEEDSTNDGEVSAGGFDVQLSQSTTIIQHGHNESLQAAISQVVMELMNSPGMSRRWTRHPYRVIEHRNRTTRPFYAPFLVFTKEDVFLHQGPLRTSMNKLFNHIVAMRRPLHPGPWVEPLPSHDRHCFFSQIPELGIFIVGSPIGRVGVFSLYYHSPYTFRRVRYGFKLEYLLPFQSGKETEIAGVTQVRLLGVAVAPIQGMFDTSRDAEVPEQEAAPHPRLWRLLMYYTDHTVLSFQLSKRRKDESSSLGDLVV